MGTSAGRQDAAPRRIITPAGVFRLCLIAAAPPLVGLLGRFHWLADLGNHFPMQSAVALLLGTATLLLLRAFRLAILALLLLALPVVRLAPLFLPPADRAAAGASLSIATFNIRGDNPRHAEVVDWIRRQDVDLWLLPETGTDWGHSLAPLRREFPHHFADLRAGNLGFSFFSRFPIEDPEVTEIGAIPLPVLTATIRHPGGDFTFIAAHPVPPTSLFWADERDRMLAELALLVEQTEGPLVLAGDLNATRWSSAIQPLFAGGLVDSSLGHGYQATWMRRNPFLAIPIDHILTRGIGPCRERHLGPALGSDHCPVIARFGRRPPATPAASAVGPGPP